MRGTRLFVATMLAPAFFFLICFYVYPTVFNIANSLTDLSLFGLKRGGAWVGVDNYRAPISAACCGTRSSG